MRIIKQGTLPANRMFVVECYHCKTIFEFQQSEGKTLSDRREGDYVYINCPTCNSQASAHANTYVK